MQLTLKGTNAKNTAAIYAGAARTIRVPLAAFVNGTAPATLSIDGDALAGPKAAKVKLTKEQRAALPKPTLAERIAKREAALAKDKAKLAAATSGM